MYLAFET